MLDTGWRNWDVTNSVTGNIRLNIMFMWTLEMASVGITNNVPWILVQVGHFLFPIVRACDITQKPRSVTLVWLHGVLPCDITHKPTSILTLATWVWCHRNWDCQITHKPGCVLTMEMKCDSTQPQIWVLHLGNWGCYITYKSDSHHLGNLGVN
jgi:hypothetical protein